jgi:hypothetical protein
MRYVCEIILILLVSRAALADGKEYIRIARIRVIIDGTEYEWTEEGIFPQNEDGETVVLKPETIVSFISVRPDLRLNVDQLESRCRDTERRIRDSGYVYEATVTIVPPRRNPAERTVVVEVLSGFFWRYGGGNAWAMIGKTGLGGERAELRLYAGYNRSGLRYLHSRVGGLPLALGGQFYYYGPGVYQGKNYGGTGNRFEAIATTGWYPHPDFFAGIDTAQSGFGLSEAGLFSVQPFFSWYKYLNFGVKSDGGINGRVFWYPLLNNSKYEVHAYIHIGISDRFTTAMSGGGGYSPNEIPEAALFDLYYTEDRSVRGGYTAAELRGKSYALGSAELRYDVLRFTFAAIFNCTIQGYAFADIGNLDGGTEARQNPLVDAFGGGIRVLFDNPVFAYFSFSYGLNHEGKGRFVFTGTAGF